MSTAILTPQTLWQSFDDSLPLKEVKLNVLPMPSANLTYCYFSGRQTSLSRVRIYGVYAEQKGKSKGSVLILPDVGDEIDVDLIIHFSSLGYDVLSVDFRGEAEGTSEHTQYPQDISYANYLTSGSTFLHVENTAKETCWYEWTAVARYAVSFLKSKKPDGRIGVVGIKHGANVLWQLAATDDRVDAAVTLFGAGWLAYRGLNKYEDLNPEMNDERYRFIAGIEAQSYAPYVKCPVLYLGTTNNDEFDFDRAADTLLRVENQSECRLIYSTESKNALESSALYDVDEFISRFVGGCDEKSRFPETPEIEIGIDGDEIIYKISGVKNDAESILVNASSNDLKSCDRVWYNVYPFEKENGEKVFRRRVYGKSDFEIAFVTVKYKSGITLSSRPAYKKTGIVSNAKIPNILLSSSHTVTAFLVKNAESDLLGNVFSKNGLYSYCEGPLGIKGVKTEYALLSYAVRKIADTLSGDSFIKFDAYSKTVDTLFLSFSAGGDDYSAKIQLTGGEYWQSIKINLGDLKNAEGRSIKDYSLVTAVAFNTLGAFMINNVIIL